MDLKPRYIPYAIGSKKTHSRTLDLYKHVLHLRDLVSAVDVICTIRFSTFLLAAGLQSFP